MVERADADEAIDRRGDGVRRRFAAGLTLLGPTLALALLLSGSAAAHEGPPFPILVDEPAAPWSVSVWADPDVGVGTFWVLLDALDAGRPLPAETRVSVHVAPADGRLPETSWVAEPGERDGRQEHVVEVDFPTREFWLVRIEVAGSEPDQHFERTLRVEVTPPGYGPIDLLLYSWPFAALALLWIKALTRRRRPPPPTAPGSAPAPPLPDPASAPSETPS